MTLTGGIELLRNKDVLDFYHYVLDEYHIPRGKKIALFLPCTATKPYSKSQTHKKIKAVIYNSGNSHPNIIHELIVSEPLGIVPRDLEDKYPAAHYDMVLDTWFPASKLPELRKKGWGNDISKARDAQKFSTKPKNKLISILSERVAEFLEKTSKDYQYRIGFVRSTHKEILKNASALSGIDIEFIITQEFTQKVINDKGVFYWVMNGMRCNESLELLDKALHIYSKRVI